MTDKTAADYRLQNLVPMGTELWQRSDSFGHKWWVCRRACALVSLLMGQGVPLSFPLVQPNSSTMDNYKIFLQFNLNKLYKIFTNFI
jgi:hypothetical protein